MGWSEQQEEREEQEKRALRQEGLVRRIQRAMCEATGALAENNQADMRSHVSEAAIMMAELAETL